MTNLPVWLLILTVFLALAVAAELTARALIRRRSRYYVFPPGLRLRVYPEAAVFPQLEPMTRFEVNAQGERGDDVPRSAEGLYRVLVGGGSQPEGFFLDQHTAWPGALQRLLEKPEQLEKLGASKVHVGSIARSGIGSEALDLIFERALPRYPRLQLIIIMVGATDVLRWFEQGAPNVLTSIRTADVFRCHPEGPFGWKPSQLAIEELVRRARRRWLRPVVVHRRAGQWVAEARAMRGRAKVIRTTVSDPTPMLDHFEFHFRRLVHRAKDHADRVLFVRQPWFEKSFTPGEAATLWHGGAGQAWREEVTTYYSFDVVSRVMWLLDARAAALADALDIEQLDLMPRLEPSLNTYYDGLHVTPAGARTVAATVAAAILRQPLPVARFTDRKGRTDACDTYRLQQTAS